MGSTYDTLDAKQTAWIARQPVFFVATAPTDAKGLVNLSPKGGHGTLRVLGPTTVAYLDLTGSGIETVAHLRENGRIVVMFCAFDGSPKVMRLHGRGRAVTNDSEEWPDLLAQFAPGDDVLHALRSIVVVEVTRISDSCGFVVPRMDFVEERQQLFKWARNREEQHGADWKTKYHQANNRQSLDGLPGLPAAEAGESDSVAALSSTGRAL